MKFSSSISILFIVSQLLICGCHGQQCSPSTERIKTALLYRNGHVVAGFYHVLIMLVTTCNNQERYHLIDLRKDFLSIDINYKVHNSDYCQALQLRVKDRKCVRPCSEVYQITNGATMSVINDVIRSYDGDFYIIGLHDCRSFAKKIMRRLGQRYSLQCGSTDGHGSASSWRVPGRTPLSCETVGPDRNC